MIDNQTYNEGQRIEIVLDNNKYIYVTPPIPKRKDIAYHDLKKEDQYYRRFEFPTEDEWSDMSNEERIAYIVREIERRKNGYWFFNNGVPCYITGHYYFYLQYFKLKGAGFPKHRRYQREFYYFYDLTEKSDDCEGQAVDKIRRSGITGCFSAIALNIVTLTPEVNIGLQNKSLDDVKKVNLGAIIFAYDALPHLLVEVPSFKLSRETGQMEAEVDEKGKPVMKEMTLFPKIGRITAMSIEFGIARKKITNTKGSRLYEDKRRKTKSLNSAIFCLPTTLNKDDAYNFYVSQKDEISKYPSGNPPNVVIAAAKPSLKGGGKFGKMSLFSTPYELDSENFLQWRDIYFRSDPRSNYAKMNGGRTESGFWNYYISGKYSLEDKVDNNTTLWDNYGEANSAFMENFILNNIRKPLEHDAAALQAVVRQYSLTEEESFRLGGKGTAFNNAHLAMVLRNITHRKEEGVMPCQKIRLEWEVVNKSVKAWLDDKADWEFYYPIDKQYRNAVSVGDDNRISPRKNTPFIMVIDPTSMADETSTGGGSKNAVVVGSLPCAGLPYNGNIIHAIYHKRPPTTKIFLDEVKKMLVFSGAFCYVERNKEWLGITLKDDGFGRFLLTFDKETGKFRQWRPSDKASGGWTDDKTIQAYIRSMEMYLKYPDLLPNGIETETDYAMTILSENLISQLMSFNPRDTEKFDLAVAACLLRMVCDGFKQPAIQTEDTDTLLAFANAFYKNKVA